MDGKDEFKSLPWFGVHHLLIMSINLIINHSLSPLFISEVVTVSPSNLWGSLVEGSHFLFKTDVSCILTY